MAKSIMHMVVPSMSNADGLKGASFEFSSDGNNIHHCSFHLLEPGGSRRPFNGEFMFPVPAIAQFSWRLLRHELTSLLVPYMSLRRRPIITVEQGMLE